MLVESNGILREGRRKVTFAVGSPKGSPGGLFPSTSDSIVTETTNGDSYDERIPPVPPIVADLHTTDRAVDVENGSVENSAESESTQYNVLRSSNTGDGELIQQLTQLVQTQIALVAAQTRAISAQSLPPIPLYSGEDEQTLEDRFERWIEQFEKRARLVGWSQDLCRYHLKMRLSKTAFQTYRFLPEDVKASYSATVSSLCSKFKPVNIEELRGMEFHQLVQKSQSVKQLGLQLQKLAKRAFPTRVGKVLDMLMKGRFFQALLPKWQQKLGTLKTDESFDKLFNRARTMEHREQQYNDVAKR